MGLCTGMGGRASSESAAAAASPRIVCAPAVAVDFLCRQKSKWASVLPKRLQLWTLLAILMLILEPADLRQRSSSSSASDRFSAEKTQQQLQQLQPTFLLPRGFLAAATKPHAAPPKEGEQQQEEEETLAVDICEGRVLLPPDVRRNGRHQGRGAAAAAEVDFSEVVVSLVAEDGTIKESEHCSPTGYFLLALDPLPAGADAAGHPATRRRRPVELRVSGPPGWLFEPLAHRLQRGRCEPHQEMQFFFRGFGIGGFVKEGTSSSSRGVSGLPVRLRRLSDGISTAEIGRALAMPSPFLSACRAGPQTAAAAADSAAAPAGEVRGQRAGRAAGEGLAAAEAPLTNTESHMEEDDLSFVTVHTDEEGQFLFSGVRPGTLELQVFHTATAPFDVAEFVAAAAAPGHAAASSSAAHGAGHGGHDGEKAPAASPAAGGGATAGAFLPHGQAVMAVAASDPLLLRLSGSGKVFLLQQREAAAASEAAGGRSASVTNKTPQPPRRGSAAAQQWGDGKRGRADRHAETDRGFSDDLHEVEAEDNKVLLQATRFGILGRIIEGVAGKPLSLPVLVGLEPSEASCAPLSSFSSSSSFEEALFNGLTLKFNRDASLSRCSAADASSCSPSTASSSGASGPPASFSSASAPLSSSALCSAAAAAATPSNAERLARYASTLFAPQVLRHAHYAVATPATSGWFLFSELPACNYRVLPATGLLLPPQQQHPEQQQQQRRVLLSYIRFRPADKEILVDSFRLAPEQQEKPGGIVHAGSFHLESFAVTGCVGIRPAATAAAAEVAAAEAAEAGAEAAAAAEVAPAARGGKGGGAAAAAGGEAALVSSCGSLEGIAGAKISIRRTRAAAAAGGGTGEGGKAVGEATAEKINMTQEVLGEGLTDAAGRFSVQLPVEASGWPLLLTAVKQHYVFDSLRVNDISWEKPIVPPLLATGVAVCGRLEEAPLHAPGAANGNTVEVYVHRISPGPEEKKAPPRPPEVFHLKQGGSFCFTAAPHNVYAVTAVSATGRQQQQVAVAAAPILDLLLSEKRYSVHGRVICPPPPHYRPPPAARDAAAAASGSAAAAAALLCSARRLAIQVVREVDESDAAAAAADAEPAAEDGEYAEKEGRGGGGGAAEGNQEAAAGRSRGQAARKRTKRGGRRLVEVWVEHAALTEREDAAEGELYFSIDGLPAGTYVFRILETPQLLQRAQQSQQQHQQPQNNLCPSLCWKRRSFEVVLPPPESEASSAGAEGPKAAAASAAADSSLGAFLQFEQSGYSLCGESNASLVAAFPPLASGPSSPSAEAAPLLSRRFFFLSEGEFSVCLAQAAPVAYDLVASPCLRLHVTPRPPFSLPLLTVGPAGEVIPGGKMHVHVQQRRVQAEVLLLLPSETAEGRTPAALQELLFRVRVASGAAAAGEGGEQHSAAVQEQQQQQQSERLQQLQVNTKEPAQVKEEQHQEVGAAEEQEEEDIVDCTFLRLVSPLKAAGDSAAAAEAAASQKRKKKQKMDAASDTPFVSALYSCLFWIPVEGEISAAADIAVQLLPPSSQKNFLLTRPVIYLSPTAAELPRLANSDPSVSSSLPRSAAASLRAAAAAAGDPAAAAASPGVGFDAECGAKEAPVVARFVVEQQCVIEGAVSPPVEGVLFAFRHAETGETVSPAVYSRRDGSFSSAAIRCRSYDRAAMALSGGVSVSAASSHEDKQHRDQVAAAVAAAASSAAAAEASSRVQRKSDYEALADLLSHTIVTASLPGFTFKQKLLPVMQHAEKQPQQQTPLTLLFTATKQATITARVRLQQPRTKKEAAATAEAAAERGRATKEEGEAAEGEAGRGLKGVLVSWSLLDDPAARAVKQLTNSEGACVFTPQQQQGEEEEDDEEQEEDGEALQQQQKKKKKVLRYRVKPLLKGYRFDPPFYTVDVPVRTAEKKQQQQHASKRTTAEDEDLPRDIILDFYAHKVLFECSGEVRLIGDAGGDAFLSSSSSLSSTPRQTMHPLARLPFTVEARAVSAGQLPHTEEAVVGPDGHFVIRGLRPNSTYEVVLHLPAAEELAVATPPAAEETASPVSSASAQTPAAAAAAAAGASSESRELAPLFRVSPLLRRVSVTNSDVAGVLFYLFPIHPDAAVVSVALAPTADAAVRAALMAESLLLPENASRLEVELVRLKSPCSRRHAAPAAATAAAAAGDAAAVLVGGEDSAAKRGGSEGLQRLQEAGKQQAATRGKTETMQLAREAESACSPPRKFVRKATLDGIGYAELRGIPPGVYLLRLLLRPAPSPVDAKSPPAEVSRLRRGVVLLVKKLKISTEQSSSSSSNSLSSRRVHVELPSLLALSERWRRAEEEGAAADDVALDSEENEDEEDEGEEEETAGYTRRRQRGEETGKTLLESGRGWWFARIVALLFAVGLLLLLVAGGTAAGWGGSSQDSSSSGSSNTLEKAVAAVVNCLFAGAGAAASGFWRWLGVTQGVSDLSRRLRFSFSGHFSSKGGGECNIKVTLKKPSRCELAGDGEDTMDEDGDETGGIRQRRAKEDTSSYTSSRYSPSPPCRRSTERHRTP